MTDHAAVYRDQAERYEQLIARDLTVCSMCWKASLMEWE